MDIRAVNNATAQSLLPAIARSVGRPEARTFNNYLAEHSSPTLMLGQDGNSMGQVIEANRARINATGGHILRGLYYVERGVPFGSRSVRIASRLGVSPADQAIVQFASLYNALRDRRSRSIGNGFSYVAAFGDDYSIWLMMLFEALVWLGTISSGTVDGLE